MKHLLLASLLCLGSASAVTVQLFPLPYQTVNLGGGYYSLLDQNGLRVFAYSGTNLEIATQPNTPGRVQIDLNNLPPETRKTSPSTYILALQGITLTIQSGTPLNITKATTNPPPIKTAQTTLSPELLSLINAAAVQAARAAVLELMRTELPKMQAESMQTIKAELIKTISTTTLQTVQTELKKTTVNQASAIDQAARIIAADTARSVATQVAKTTATETARTTASEVARAEVRKATSDPVSPPLAREVRNAGMGQLPGLPSDITGSINMVDTPEATTISYSLINLGGQSYTLNVDDLNLTQGGVSVRAQLDRRNGNLSPGLLQPGKGEIGRITVPRVSNGPLVLKWKLRTGSTAYTLNITHQP